MNEAESDALLETIRAVRDDEGCTILIVDHDLRLIMRLCERIHVLAEGRTIGEGTRRGGAARPSGDRRLPGHGGGRPSSRARPDDADRRRGEEEEEDEATAAGACWAWRCVLRRRGRAPQAAVAAAASGDESRRRSPRHGRARRHEAPPQTPAARSRRRAPDAADRLLRRARGRVRGLRRHRC